MLTIPGKFKFLLPPVINPLTITLTDALTNLFTVQLADGDMVGGYMMGLVRASNGTDQQADTILTTWAAVRKGATTSGTHTYVSGNQALANSAGTFTISTSGAAGYTDAGTGLATFGITPAGSLTETTYNFTFVVYAFRGTVVYTSGVSQLTTLDPR